MARGEIVALMRRRSVSWLLAAKCFSEVPTPLDCTPLTMPTAVWPARYGSSLQYSKQRPPSGLRLMLTPGPRMTATCSWMHSSPIASPTRSTSSGFHEQAMPAAGGKQVAGTFSSTSIDSVFWALRRPCGPSVMV